MSKVSLNKIKNILSKPLDDLIFEAQTVHKKNFKSSSFQLASLISIKTGSCPEDCKYCPQSAHYKLREQQELPNLMEPIDFVWELHGKSLEMEKI